MNCLIIAFVHIHLEDFVSFRGFLLQTPHFLLQLLASHSLSLSLSLSASLYFQDKPDSVAKIRLFEEFIF
jgi:hypothetical protein